MKPKCDRCEQDATVTEVVVKDGKRLERHLCEKCAREAGIAIQSTPIDKLVSSFLNSQVVVSQSSSGPSPESAGKKGVANACKSCGLAYAEFKQKGLLGCPECYKAFESQLAPLIERAHQGSTHHVGKTPHRGEPDDAHRERLALLRKQLTEAIAAEQYERAALLRDELTRRAPAATEPTVRRVTRQDELSEAAEPAAERRPRARSKKPGGMGGTGSGGKAGSDS